MLKKIFCAAISAAVVFSTVSCEGLFPFLSTEEHFRPYDKKYTLNELSVIQSASFKKLNDVTYPATREIYEISDDFRAAVNNFAYRIYVSADKSKENFSFSPMGLYDNLSLLALASSDPTALAALDSVLGMTKETRKEDFVKAYKTDFYVAEKGTTQLYNAAFLTNEYEANPDFVAALTEHMAEAYSLNFQSDEDVSKMLKWADDKIKEKSFLKKSDLEITKDSAMFVFSALYFDNKWVNVFDAKHNKDDTFYAKSAETKATFMRHTYSGDCYDYGDYVACYDYYHNGMKVKYVVPKEKDGDIFALTDGVNFLKDDESKKILAPLIDEEHPEYGRLSLIINLTLPKFKSEYMTDFSPVLKDVGLGYLFEKDSGSFNYAFKDLPANVSMHLTFTKQKNKISFNEEGAVIKSVTVSEIGKSMSPGVMKTVDVTLDRPFIYVVYDPNGLPLYIGNLNVPRN